MHMRHNRVIAIKKADLIAKITENKEKHIKEFEEAKEAYVIEANKQIEKAKKELDGGSFEIFIKLTTPVNRAEEYDKVIGMFTWEVKEEIELTQSEFNDYIYDDNDSSRAAKFSNSFYSSGR